MSQAQTAQPYYPDLEPLPEGGVACRFCADEWDDDSFTELCAHLHPDLQEICLEEPVCPSCLADYIAEINEEKARLRRGLTAEVDWLDSVGRHGRRWKLGTFIAGRGELEEKRVAA